MDDVASFGLVILVVSAAFMFGIASQSITERLSVPAPLLFLGAAAIASDLYPSVALTPRDIEKVAVVALIVILLDGGMAIGWIRFRAAVVPIVALGVLGTLICAVLLSVAAHYALGVPWLVGALLGAALAPTDPAVLFSVLGQREVGGRSGTILEGESGANDPVGIALMLAVIAYAATDGGGVSTAVSGFVLEMAVGIVVGVLGGLLMRRLLRSASLPSDSLYPLRALALGGAVYGAAALAHGSGFLAVFIAGLLVGDLPIPFKREVVGFHGALAGIAEMVVFAGLGLTINLGSIGELGAWIDGVLLAAILAFVIRPAVVLALLTRVRLTRGERVFVAWFGLKGAVPILLAAFALSAGIAGSDRVYALVFVVVFVSVLVQGVTVGPVARRLGVPLHRIELDPWE